MSRAALCSPLLGAALKRLPPAPGRTAGEPAESLRSLQALQDEIAHGSADAQLRKALMLGANRRAAPGIKPEAWKEPGNARAAVAFVLSGGDLAS